MLSLCPARNIDAPKGTRRFWVKGVPWVDVGTYLRVLPSFAVSSCFYSPNNSVLRKVLTTFVGCPPWCWMVCPPFRGLVSPCLPACVPLLDCASAFSRSCLLLSPLVPHCHPTCVPLFDVVTAFPRPCLPACPVACPSLNGVSAFPSPCGVSTFLNPWLPCSQVVSQLVSFCSMVRSPSKALSPLSRRLSPTSPSLSPSLSPACLPACLGACLPSCFPLSDCVSTSRGLVTLVSQLVSQLVFLLFPFVGWCVHLREALSPLSPVSLSLPPNLSSSLSPSLFPFVGWPSTEMVVCFVCWRLSFSEYKISLLS